MWCGGLCNALMVKKGSESLAVNETQTAFKILLELDSLGGIHSGRQHHLLVPAINQAIYHVINHELHHTTP